MTVWATLTVAEFSARVKSFAWTRRVNEVHCHHTWIPNRASWVGVRSMDAMRAFHVEQNGWSAIAQHCTIAPDGAIWTGDRDWNKPPASSSGHNGNARVGPWMWEAIGNFDIGREPFDGPQRIAAVAVTAIVQAHFGLPVSSLRFHRQLNNGQKTCPGSAVDYIGFSNEVAAYRACNASLT